LRHILSLTSQASEQMRVTAVYHTQLKKRPLQCEQDAP